MEDEFPAKRILDENVKKRTYKVDWEGVNPETGRSWSPTWEPYEYVSEMLVKEWEQKKRRRSDADFQKASRAALRDFDIKRNRTETPSEEEYVSPAEEKTDLSRAHYSDEEEVPIKQKAKPRSKRKPVSVGSGSSYKPTNRSTRSSEQSTELSTFISPGSLKALQSQKGMARGSPAITTSNVGMGKRQRQDESPASSHPSRPIPKKSRRNLDNGDAAAYTSGETSESDQGVPVVASRTRLSSGSRESARAKSYSNSAEPVPRLKAIPESLRLRTATTSVSTITRGPSSIQLDNIFSVPKDTRRDSRQLPPSARRVDLSSDESARAGSTNAARRAQLSRNAQSRLVSKPLSRRRSDDGPSGLAEANLPSFKKASKQAAPPSEDAFHVHQRKASAVDSEPRQEWALLDYAGKDASPPVNGSDASPCIVQDSAPKDERTISPVLSPPRSVHGNSTNGHSKGEVRRHTRSPGSRLAHANIEKPRMPIKVPEPTVFRPFLEATQMTEDIQQFSSQVSPPEASSSEEVLRDLVAHSHPIADQASAITKEVVETTGVHTSAAEVSHIGQDFDMAREAPYDLNSHPNPSSDSPVVASVVEISPQPLGGAPREVSIQGSPDHGQIDTAPNAVVPSAVSPEVQQSAMTEDAGVEAGASSQTQSKRVLGPSEIREVVQQESIARKMIRDSKLISSEDTRQDLLLFIEIPAFYCQSLRPLTAQPSWDFELHESTDEEGQTSWHLLIDIKAQDWKLERRVRPYMVVSEDEANDQVMSLYNDLLTAHAALKNENDALTLRAGQLERDVAFLRQQDRSKGEKMESLAAEKRKLEAELQVLRQQVTLGVKQVELIWSAKEKRLKQELDIAKKQLDPAQALVKASGVGTLLEKAAQMDELIAVKERHRQAAAEMQARKQVESLSSVFKASDDQALSAVVKSRAEDESEDGDFVGGSDSDSGSSSGESDDERSYDMAPSDIEAQNLSLGLSAVQYSDLPAAELVNTALASAEGILPGGLASISPAPVALGPAIAAPRRDGPDGHTSGDTTEVTTSVAVDTASVNIEKKDDSQQSGSSQSTRLIESEEILELDSGILESQLAYPCNWGQSSGAECRKLFASQRELYDHVVDEHATPIAWV